MEIYKRSADCHTTFEIGRFRMNEVRPALFKQGPTRLTKYTVYPKITYNKKGQRGESIRPDPIQHAESIRDLQSMSSDGLLEADSVSW